MNRDCAQFGSIAAAGFFAAAAGIFLSSAIGLRPAWASDSNSGLALAQPTEIVSHPVAASTDAAVKGKPYEAERILHTRRALADGTISTHDFSIREARDSSGRVLEEYDTDLPAATGKPPVHVVTESLFDPATRTMLLWNSLSKTGNLFHLPPQPPLSLNGQLPPAPAENPVSLGHRMIHGLLCTGYSVQKSIAAGAMGNATPLVTRHEWWIDNDLQVKALEILDDPLHGESTNELLSIHLGEPDLSRFHLPSGYTVHEIGQPGPPDRTAQTDEALDLAHAPALTHQAAIEMLASQDLERQKTGAAVLVKEAQASDDPVLKDNVAYRLERANVGLNEALSLASAATGSAEHECATLPDSPAGRPRFAAEIALARDWDTLGALYNRKGDAETARSYLESAWQLDPLAYYAFHLGRILEQSGDSVDAIAVYRAALQATGGNQLKEILRERIAALAGDAAAPADDAEETIPNAGKLTGSAFFDILYFSGAGSPTAAFVSGAEPLRVLVSAIAQREKADFALPDAGPERVVRRVEVLCGAQAGTDPSCKLRALGAHEARTLLENGD